MTTTSNPATTASAGPASDSRAPLSRLTDRDLDRLLLIRHFEAALLDLFAAGRLHGTTHTCTGQEYVPVALYRLLDDADFVFSNHRGHGHYLARFGDPHSLLAEIMGRDGAVCRGVGGSQHIFRDRYLSTGVQGESLPVAVGVALHFAQAEPGRIAVAHIGDGTWGQGAVYEALNMAALWRVPLLVAVEHNGIAQSTPTEVQMAGTIAARAAAFGIPAYRTATIDVNALREELAPLIRHCREHGQPQVVEFVTRRLGPHSKGDDSRSPEQIEALRADDWYRRYADAHPDHLRVADARQRAVVAEVVGAVERLPPAVWADR